MSEMRENTEHGENPVNDPVPGEQLEPGSEESGTMSFTAKLAGIFFDPRKVARSVAEKPDWVLPFIVVLLASLLFIAVDHQEIVDSQLDAAMEKMQSYVDSGRMTQEQVDMALQQQGKFMTTPIMMGFTVMQVLLSNLVVAVLLLFFGNIIFGGSKKFKHYWSLAFYASLISALGTVVAMILVKMTGDMNSAKIGFGFLTGGAPETFIGKFLKNIEVFGVWSVVVYGIGLSAFTRVKQSKAITTVLVVYLVILALLALI